VSEPAAVVTDDAVREEEYEARFEAAPAVLVILCLQVVITLVTNNSRSATQSS